MPGFASVTFPSFTTPMPFTNTCFTPARLNDRLLKGLAIRKILPEPVVVSAPVYLCTFRR